MLVESVRDIAESEFAEKAGAWQGAKPWPNLELLADRGYLGVSLPEEYGGGGMSEFDAILLQETVGRVCPDTAYALPDMGAPRAVAMFGSEAVKERYLPPVCAGEDHVAIAISEPEAGSDVTSMNTHIEEEGGELYLTGEKIWVSGVHEEGSAVVWTKFPGEGLGTVIMEFDQPGVEIQQHFTNMFGHQQSQFYMEEVHIPEENVLTRGPEGFKEQLKALNWERVGNAALCNGTALCAFDAALEYAGDREQGGHAGQRVGDPRYERIAVFGIADGRGQDVGERPCAVVAQYHQPGAERTRHAAGQQAPVLVPHGAEVPGVRGLAPPLADGDVGDALVGGTVADIQAGVAADGGKADLLGVVVVDDGVDVRPGQDRWHGRGNRV
jgi:hypothetical protein